MCVMHIYMYGGCAFLQPSRAAPPLRPSSSAWAALRVMNNDRAQRYGATANRPDRHLTPSSLASPSDPSLTCAVPCAAR
jgi:hypothetical protein